MKKISIGIVGLGTIAQTYHIPILSSFKDVRIEAVADTDARRREMVARKWNITKVYKSDIEMYENSNLDAVFACVPNFFHHSVVKNALKYHVHVFCEKPFGLSSDRAYEIARMAEQKSILTVGYNRRLEPNCQKAACITQSMRLGRIVQVQGTFLLRGPYIGYKPKSDWFFEERSGGALYDVGSHLFDVMIYVLSDKIAEVSARSLNVLNLRTTDNIAGLFRTEGGSLGTFIIGWQAVRDYANPFIHIHGTGGSLSFDSNWFEEIHASYGPVEKVVAHLKCAGRTISTYARDYRRKIDETYVVEDRAFVDSVRGKGRPFVLIDEAVHVLEVLEAIRDSVLKEKSCIVKHHSSSCSRNLLAMTENG